MMSNCSLLPSARPPETTTRASVDLRVGGEAEARKESFGGIGTAVLVAVFGSRYNVLSTLNLPRIPIDEGSLGLAGACAGGKQGEQKQQGRAAHQGAGRVSFIHCVASMPEASSRTRICQVPMSSLGARLRSRVKLPLMAA